MRSEFLYDSPNVAVRVRDVSKHYAVFARSEDRFKQMVMPRVQRLLGLTPERYYNDFAALRGVSFEINRGETVGIVGRNGSGKSTLLQIVCGTLQPTSGNVEVSGRVAALLELGAGFDPEFTGRENVYLNAAILGLTRREIDERFESIVRFADIGGFIDQPVKAYSSGMYVRLAFATAINVDPDVLVVDEALAVGDEAFQRKCFSRIEEIKDKGGTILFVSHSAQSIVQLCTRAILIDAGEKIFEGSPKMVVSQYQRLVNADQEMAPDIRNSIVALMNKSRDRESVEDAEAEAVTSVGLVERRSDETPVDVQPQLSPKSSSSFDPNLKTKSRIDYESTGAKITGLRLSDLRGRPANVLETGRRYIFEYDVLFEQEAADVGFGIGLRATSGFSFGGANLEQVKHERLACCAAGTTTTAAFEFKCVLLPSAYFINLAVIGARDGARGYLARSVDVLMFRVMSQERTMAGGSIDFEIQLSLRKSR